MDIFYIVIAGGDSIQGFGGLFDLESCAGEEDGDEEKSADES